MIRLRVESFRGRPLSEPREAVFDSAGGTIGRSETNKLFLPDPERHVSRIHAKVMCRDGQFSVADQGSNPVLLNGRPIGHGMTAPLGEGDVLAIGEYLIRVDGSGVKAPPPPPVVAPVAPAPRAASPVAAPQAGAADPLGLFGDTPAPAVGSGGGAFDDLLGSAGSSIPDPFADIAPPKAAPRDLPPPPPPPPAPAAPPASGHDLFRDLGASAPSAPPPLAGGIPDDFDPFADPFAAPPAKKPTAELPNDLGLSDAGIARNNFGESADLDSLFALDKESRKPDPFSNSPLGEAMPGLPGSADQDPLVAFGGAAKPLAPESAPDNVPEIHGSFKIPSVPQIPDDTLLGAREPKRPAEPPPKPAAAAPVPERKPPPPPPRPPAPAPRPQPVAPAAAAPVSAPAPMPAPPASAPSAGRASPDELLAALKRGLQVSDLPLDGTLTPQMMENIGALVRVSTQGTLDLLLARAMTKREVKAEMTMIVSRGNNPLKFSPNLSMALGHLFGPQRKGFMTPTEAMRDAYDDLRSHQFGFMAGMRAALEGVLKRFTPEILEGRLTRKSMIDSLLPMNRKAKLWDLYTEMYQEISREAEDDFHTLFGKEFLRAYEEQIERLDQANEDQA